MSYHGNVIAAAKANAFFRKVLHTAPNSQLVVMCLQPGEDIGAEVHDLDQILVFVEGEGEYHLNDSIGQVASGDAVVVPAGVHHNFTNTGDQPLKLYTVYAPPEHPPGTIHRTKAEADAAEAEHHAHGVHGGVAPPKAGIQAPSGLTVGSLIGK